MRKRVVFGQRKGCGWGCAGSSILLRSTHPEERRRRRQPDEQGYTNQEPRLPLRARTIDMAHLFQSTLRLLKLCNELLVSRKPLRGIRRDHALKNTGRRGRNVRRDGVQIKGPAF